MEEKSLTDIIYAKEILFVESEAIKNLMNRLDHNFQKTIDMVFACKGRIVVTGIGKAGIIGQKISATLASTGTPSYWIHSSEAKHGDLGRIVTEDIVLALSNSGETEVVALLPFVKQIGAKVIAITGNGKSSLAFHSDVVLDIGKIDEPCPLGLAPSASSTAMLALGDALALTVFKKRNLSKKDYAFYHPGGELGRKLLTVEMVMRRGEENPVADEDLIVQDVLTIMTETTGKPGAVSIVNKHNKLVGFFTDGDIRRYLKNDLSFLRRSVKEVMTQSPKVINKNCLAAEAYKILKDCKIDQIPVVDDSHTPIGIIDVQDFLEVGF
ncbi:MAG: KpsF/GutQ family sugar-phosphate isomerase [Candidatus Loosdrechtia sp.]|uniref:KpsF/GutQ family sugar-phosphate isomerase n=1 Tax=Candidatus Loosdrechtia sp. TaxID=3101272 RepID=UPI003A5E107C|nr:MAG: KpsF/GutQ family sugar-phosphate isomerase [Candidatus Jettenia sp. AMX2]